MKYLYVWEGKGVLQDYTPGMICVVADNLDNAYKAIKTADHVAVWQHEGEEAHWNFPQYPTTIVDLDTTPAVAFTCWGGG